MTIDIDLKSVMNLWINLRFSSVEAGKALTWPLAPDPSTTTTTRFSELERLVSQTETSEEDDENEDESDSDDDDDDDDGGCEESGLGLLARFAASALPVSSTPLSLLHEGKHRSRQSTLGNPAQHALIENCSCELGLRTNRMNFSWKSGKYSGRTIDAPPSV